MAALVNFRLIGKNKFIFLKHPSKYKLKNVNFLKSYTTDTASCKSSEVVIRLTKGKSIVASTGKLARLADGCATVSVEDTTVMATVVSNKNKTDKSFFPLTVDYRQKAAAAGRIPVNFFRREFVQTTQEILISRLIDRSIRPLFPKNYSFETQISCNMLALDGTNDPDVIAINAASAALAVSDIPWDGPVGAVRVGFIDNQVVINPSRKDIQKSSLNLVISATNHNMVVMLEGSAEEIMVTDLQKAIKTGTKECQYIIKGIEALRQKHGKTKRPVPDIEKNVDIENRVKELAEERLREIFTNYSHNKLSRDEDIKNLKNEVIENFQSVGTEFDVSAVNKEFDELSRQTLRSLIFSNEIRCDGRKFTELRPINCEVDVYKPLHGSALFQRGQTQVLCTVTLDSLESALRMDPVTMLTSGIRAKNFFLHYEFPPYATNETGRIGVIGRRELGHGALAERGLMPILPKDYPFTVRLTSEVLESNGSSSMASVCGGSLALLDAGVPITSPAAGVALGLVTQTNPETKEITDYHILTDILGIEDYMGDMDFKLAGTKKGINSIQADIKIPGLPLKIVMETLLRAIHAKTEIIKIMNETISQPRLNKQNMPVTEKIEVLPNQRSKFLGSHGENLKKILYETGVSVSHSEDNTYTIFAPNSEAMEEAKEVLNKLLEEQHVPELEFGGIYTAKVVEVREIGVMVTLYPNMSPAFIHNSQLDQRLVSHPSALNINVNDELQVKYFGRDPVSGNMRLSRKVLQAASNPVLKNYVTNENTA